MEHDVMAELFEAPLSAEAVIAIIANDLAQMTEAQLASLLTNFFLEGPSPVADAIVPLARRELGIRRLITAVEGIAANV